MALMWPWCGLGGALVEPWCGFRVALRWLCTPESMPSIWLWCGFRVALKWLWVALKWLWVALPGLSALSDKTPGCGNARRPVRPECQSSRAFPGPPRHPGARADRRLALPARSAPPFGAGRMPGSWWSTPARLTTDSTDERHATMPKSPIALLAAHSVPRLVMLLAFERFNSASRRADAVKAGRVVGPVGVAEIGCAIGADIDVERIGGH